MSGIENELNRIASFDQGNKKTEKDVSASTASDTADDPKTNWRLIITAGFIGSLMAMENSVIGIGEWPYMSQIDPEAHAQFFGFASSSSKCGHALFAMIFSILSYKMKSTRIPLIIGRCVALVACIIYLCVEFVPTGRRYVMMTVYILLGISNSASTVLRAYITTVSSKKDRPRAFAVIGLSMIASIVLAPLLQLIFSQISYPGFELVPGIRFHIYSAPIWFSFLFTILTIFIIFFFLEDSTFNKLKMKKDDDDVPSLPSMNKIRLTIEKIKKMNLDWKLILICLVVKIGATFSHSTMQTIMSLFFMVQYGWTGEETVQIASIVMIGFGALSCLLLICYIFCKIGEIFPQHYVFVIGTISSGIVFVITYPYSFISSPVVAFNETTKTGCNILEYTWCDSALAINPYFFIVIVILFSAPSIPLMSISLDTIYSKILGKIDQNVGQGAMTIVDDIVGILTPVFTTSMFVYFGIGPLWIAKSFVFLFIVIVWLSNLKRISIYL